MPPLADTFPGHVEPVAFWSWLTEFWDHAAGLQTDDAERARCEDEAWRCCRMAEQAKRRKV